MAASDVTTAIWGIVHHERPLRPLTGLMQPPRRIAETDFSTPQACGQAPAGRCPGVPETAVTA